ncbi:MAG: hypothetical protein HY744_17630 [Deltaproteobacteria bacterium]|nr:hypothetical protein [Deltaproteobacteria bacterium]
MDCRTTSCIGVVEWPSYDAALRRGLGAILHQDYTDLNCGREMALPPPEGSGAGYQATVVLDCASLRAREP